MNGTCEINKLHSNWESLSEYERKRYSNVIRNWEVLKSLGVASKLPKFLEPEKKAPSKVNKFPRNQQSIPKSQQNVKDFEKTSFKLFAASESQKRNEKLCQKSKNYNRFTILLYKKCSCKYESMIELLCKNYLKEPEMKIHPREFGLKKFARTLLERAQRHFKDLEPFLPEDDQVIEDEIDKELEIPSRYPKRNIKQKSYKEEDVSSDDEFLYCDFCDCDYKGACPKHGPMLWVCDRRVPKNSSDRAELTIPSFLSIGISSIPKAGLGIWTEIPLPIGTVFGPYKGKIIRTRQEAEKSGYSWMVWKGERVNHYIEGFKKDISNWLRFVNCADKEEKQNLVAIQYKKQIYYKTYRDVLPFQELLVWYGGKYASDLGISLKRDIETNQLNMTSILHLWFMYIHSMLLLFLQQLAVRSEINIVYIIGVEGVACDVCSSLFTSVDAMERHRRKHPHQGHDRRHRCPHCVYSTNNTSNLRHHLTTHTGVRRHGCPHCHKTFTEKGSLKTHLRIHSGERPFSCGVCGSDFIQKGHLERHERSHSGIRPYRCSTCGRDFTQLAHLQAHIRIHTLQRPYKCSVCQYRATTSSNLNKHVILKHTKQFPHKCHLCERGFVKQSLLKRHKDRIHPQYK
nr:histone-lysine N-methyltransferase PRDM9-like [Parasteatoda tepidariorum]